MPRLYPTAGRAAPPLFYVSTGQVNAPIPFELTAGQPYQVIVSNNGALSTPESIQSATVTPGVAYYASGYAKAEHVDGTLITAASPSPAGRIHRGLSGGDGADDSACRLRGCGSIQRAGHNDRRRCAGGHATGHEKRWPAPRFTEFARGPPDGCAETEALHRRVSPCNHRQFASPAPESWRGWRHPLWSRQYLPMRAAGAS
jgi:hypothetical protein